MSQLVHATIQGQINPNEPDKNAVPVCATTPSEQRMNNSARSAGNGSPHSIASGAIPVPARAFSAAVAVKHRLAQRRNPDASLFLFVLFDVGDSDPDGRRDNADPGGCPGSVDLLFAATPGDWYRHTLNYNIDDPGHSASRARPGHGNGHN